MRTEAELREALSLLEKTLPRLSGQPQIVMGGEIAALRWVLECEMVSPSLASVLPKLNTLVAEYDAEQNLKPENPNG